MSWARALVTRSALYAATLSSRPRNLSPSWPTARAVKVSQVSLGEPRVLAGNPHLASQAYGLAGLGDEDFGARHFFEEG